MRFFRAAALLALVLFSLAAAAFSGGAGAQGTAKPKAYGYIILNAWDAHLIPKIRKQHPGVKVLAYKDMSLTFNRRCVNGHDEAHFPGGVGICDATRNHPDWFLTKPSGGRINSWWFKEAWLMDVGNPAYQRAWLATVLKELKGQGWDGVWADDADADPNWHLQGRVIAKYPTIKSWQVATRSMLARVGPAVQANRLLFIPNFQTPWNGSYNALAIWKDWLQFTSGASQEYFSKWGDRKSSWFVDHEWTFREAFQRATQAQGKIFLGITYAPRGDTRSLNYARANFLLNWSDRKSALLFKHQKEMGDPTTSTWKSPIGTAVGNRKRAGGAWLRRYTGGVVVVNPSLRKQRVKLGKVYVDARGRRVSAVTLGSATGAVLKRTPPLTRAP